MIGHAEKISQYLRLSNEIARLEEGLADKESELQRKYAADYSNLKKVLGGYIAKIRPTVETVCNLYKGKVQLRNDKIFLPEGPVTQSLHGSDPCVLAIKAGNEGIQLLSAIIQRINVDANLREFAIRYNTVAEIYAQADKLQEQAVCAALDAYKQEIAMLQAQRSTLFSDPRDFVAMQEQLQENSHALHQTVILNDSKALEQEFVTHIALPLGYDTCEGSVFGWDANSEIILSSLDWKLHEDGIMVIRSDGQNIDSSELSNCVVNAVIQFLFSYPAASKRILLCDSCSSHTITTFAGILKSESSELFFDNGSGSYTKNTDDEIRTSLSELGRIVNERIMVLGQSHCRDTLEYNSKNQDNPLPIILVLLNGYPHKYENSWDNLASVLKNGKAAGVYFLVTENTQDDEDAKYYRKRLPELNALTNNVVDFIISDGRGYLCQGDNRYLSKTCGANYSMSSILSVFKSHAASNTGKVVYLDSVVEKESFTASPRRHQYSQILSIPFGKQGANPVCVDLGANGSDAHLAVIGTTGSGKTAFINTLVLSACKLYSPAELELHLILMVKSDFNIFAEQGLPHLKTVVTGSSIFAANDVLDFIDEEMKRRGDLIGSFGNIYAYNKVAAQPLPRCMIVIDEFYQLVQGSDDAIDRINRIAQVGRAYGISLVVSSIRFPMEVNSIIPLFGNRVEFKSGENAGQLIPQAAARQSELEGAKGLCFFSHGGDLHSVTVAYSEEGDRLNEHIQQIKNKYPDCKMDLQSQIRAVRVASEQDAPFTTRRAKSNYEEEGIIRTRLGKTHLSNKALEYPFDAKNNLLFLLGHYLDTKNMEASLIKDTLVLSKGIDEPTVYYIDYNKNASLKRAKTAIKRLRDHWVLSGKMVYSGSDEAEDTLEEIKELIRTRESDDESELYPVLVVIARADDLFTDDDLCEMLCEIISRGKECNVYFAIQCNEPVSFYGSDKFVTDAIIFPDRYSEGDESYSSTALCAALEAMPAGSTEKGRKLLANAAASALDPKLHLLCDNNRMAIFVPYEYDEEYLKNITD